MGKETGFLEYARKEPEYRPVQERIGDFKAVEIRLVNGEARTQAARCMDCGTPFCHAYGCPLANFVPEWNDYLFKGKLDSALALLLETNPFPEFTGRICPAPCEASCVLGIIKEPVAIRQIELSIIEQAFENGLVTPRPPSQRKKKRVAIVGSGPAGLAAADGLNRLGFDVVIYENARKPGGILRYGIPDFKLEKWVIDRRVDIMRREGIVFETCVEVGRDVSYRYLQDRFDAVILTGGARAPRDISAPGRDLDGIHFAMTYLVQQNKKCGGEPLDDQQIIDASGKNVVVLGGGDTGADCVGTALRQGAKSVKQFEILPRPPDARDAQNNPWPAWPNILRHSTSHKEGGEREWCVATERFIGRDGKVAGLDCCKVEWAFNEKGVKTPKKIPGSEFKVQADLVLLAMGFIGPGPNRLVEDLGLSLDSKGFILRSRNGMTSKTGVFVAGDMSQGASLVVRAIADGKKAAKFAADFLA